MSRLGGIVDWLDSRTGIRTARKHLLDEPIPAGVGWWFVTGSVLILLLSVQLVTGIFLTMYYVPSPESAYDSVRYIMERVTFGRVLRGLHFFGASFIVIAAVIHMLRVVALGSYKKPREVTWITGVVLLLVILGFALSGYLLPWDQKAYWATTVSINIAKSGPMGEWVSGLMMGGTTLGSLTLLRWYTAHVFLLPGALITFVVAHLYLMRRHGISGALKPVSGEAEAVLPVSRVQGHGRGRRGVRGAASRFAIIVPAAARRRGRSDGFDLRAAPRVVLPQPVPDAEVLPGPLEPVATMVIPGLVVGLLLLLPFLDSHPDRHPFKRPLVTSGFAIIGTAILVLTYLGYKDTPAHADPSRWTPMAIAGHEFTRDARCVTCHTQGGAANPISNIKMTHGPEWLIAHSRDPEIISPGTRPVPDGAFLGVGRSVDRQLHGQGAHRRGLPARSPTRRGRRRWSIGRYCASCHMIEGEGGSAGPDLTHEGAKQDAKWLKEWIADPSVVDPTANMPPFGDRLSADELTQLSNYLAARK